MMPKIYLWTNPAPDYRGAFTSYAMAEDGTALGYQRSEHQDIIVDDMIGVRQAALYEKHYPDGYDLEWVRSEDLPTHQGLNAAVKANRSRIGGPIDG